MKLGSPRKLRFYSFLFCMPLIDIAVNQILYGERLWKDTQIWLVSFPIVFVLGYLSWYTRVCFANAVERRFPQQSDTSKRIQYKLVVCFASMFISNLLFAGIYHYFHILGYHLNTVDLLKGIALTIIVNLVFETLYEAHYAAIKYKEAEEEKEVLKQMSIQEEFEALKKQLNPHFLFNCFNTLSSLISEDKPRATIFLNELSRVYRYLLKNNKEEISTLENEIKFIRSYYQLLQTRYGNAIFLHINIEDQYKQYVIPSLSLQLLVENAVKHNMLTKDQPLHIQICTRENMLLVSNNLQKRTKNVVSNKIGLYNIRSKYELLKKPGFNIVENGDAFTVMLPLIKPSEPGPAFPAKEFKPTRLINLYLP